MPKLLCKVVDTFSIQGRGVVAVLEEGEEWRIPPDEVIKHKEVIRILHPEGASVQTFLKEFEFVTKANGTSQLAITFPKNIELSDVPPGSLIFLEREDADSILWDGTPLG